MVIFVQQRTSELFRTIALNKSQKTNLVQKSAIAPPEAASAKGNGSGVIVSTSGYVLTAAHVVAGSAKVTVITAQGARSAKVVQIDQANDVAILKLETGTYRALPVIPSQRIRLGQMVATIGFPIVNVQGFSPKVTRGEISSMNGAGDDPRKWQISAPVQPGNSGGPLLDEQGNVIGVVVSKLLGETVQNVNYAVKSTYALGLLAPYLGDDAPKPILATPPPSFEDMVAKAEQSVVLVLIYGATGK
jgi:S1-C subfamily serine protease